MVSMVFLEVAGEVFALPLSRVVEVLPALALAKVPDAAGYVLGLMNCRGKLVPVVDLAVRLSLRAAPALQASAQIVVVHLTDGSLGCLVDKTIDVVAVTEDALLSPSQLVPSDVSLDLGLLAGAVKRAAG